MEKPLSTLWKNYTGSSKPDVQMKVTVTQAGLKAVTKEHGLTEYWSHRITYCAAPASFPRIFCWVYRHEGRKLKQELRCHAVLCPKEAVARRMASQLKAKLAQSLSEFKRDKVCRQNARLSLANSVYENPSLPRRKILLSTGSHNYKPPLERSKSAPKLMVIEECVEEGDEDCDRLCKEAMVLNRLDEAVGEEGDYYRNEQYCSGDVVEQLRGAESEGGGLEPRRGAGERRVSWKCDDQNHQTERLLVIGPCKEGDFRRSTSSAETTCKPEVSSNCEVSGSEGPSRAPCLKPYVYEDADLPTPEDEVEVDLHPTGGPLKRRYPVNVEVDRLSAQLRRSATFPPPAALGCLNGGEEFNFSFPCIQVGFWKV